MICWGNEKGGPRGPPFHPPEHHQGRRVNQSSNHPPSRLRLQLLANGYTPLPGLDKTCRVKGWNSDFLEREIARHGSYEAAIVAWDTERRDHRTTNVQVRDRLVVFDVDVDVSALSKAFSAALSDVTPGVFNDAPARYGSGEFKIAYFARLYDTDEPFIRHGSRKYTQQDRPSDAGGSRITIMSRCSAAA